jgi:hypothetical protein
LFTEEVIGWCCVGHRQLDSLRVQAYYFGFDVVKGGYGTLGSALCTYDVVHASIIKIHHVAEVAPAFNFFIL